MQIGEFVLIQGISHLTFIVKNIETASTFFRSIFDAKEIYSSEHKTFSLSKEKFFLINDLWIAIMEGESLSERTYNHVAFRIEEDEFVYYESKIRELGLELRTPRSRVDGEGRSLYFYDFDNHLFELHTGTLSERLSRNSSATKLPLTTKYL
ncbi:FosX/FosE/FosI family fosfomycin resistance hydrolase [Desulfosporosinus sp. FKA]|uniref:FosX/FosE/FosI family fosfomycin resistance hydrolase n=1 Tax=Desulfosporosinus sp. FKA TaxID=1969834 RepID=UPI00249EE89D|nr:FosX/FosE/FosI family fosfomycin resistance hydrolase [Desulfosporosinus sp. FKA]